jgi:Zn-dependent protease with chaperone function
MDSPEVSSRTAVYFDGQSSRRHDVELHFDDALDIVEHGTRLASWNYADMRRVDAPVGILRLWSTAAPPLARIEIRDPVSRQRVEGLCPGLTGAGGTGSISALRITAWSLAAASVIIAMIWFGVPLAADQLAEVLPLSWERPLGQAIDQQVRAVFSGPVCTRQDGHDALTKLVSALQSSAHLPIAPDPVVLRSTVPNAFALPGGRVYVLSALLQRARSADEIAGVLAHEFGHVSHRDGVRRLIRDGGTAFLVGLLFGDVSGAGAALYAGRSLLSAAYSRDVEAGADAFAIKVMHDLGRPTAPMGDLLLRITGPQTEAFSILSDHPLTPERARHLAQEDPTPLQPELLDAAEFQALRSICQ